MGQLDQGQLFGDLGPSMWLFCYFWNKVIPRGMEEAWGERVRAQG